MSEPKVSPTVVMALDFHDSRPIGTTPIVRKSTPGVLSREVLDNLSDEEWNEVNGA